MAKNKEELQAEADELGVSYNEDTTNEALAESIREEKAEQEDEVNTGVDDDDNVTYDDDGNKKTEVRASAPWSDDDEAEIEGPFAGDTLAEGRQGPPLQTDVKEVRPVDEDLLEPGSGPVVEQVLEDHITDRMPGKE